MRRRVYRRGGVRVCDDDSGPAARVEFHAALDPSDEFVCFSCLAWCGDDGGAVDVAGVVQVTFEVVLMVFEGCCGGEEDAEG